MIPFWKKTGKHSKPQSAQKRRQNAKPAVPWTAQQSIPMQRMFEDGTCRVRPGYYTRTIQYQDINYQLAQQEDKTAIFEEWCSFLNFFDSSIKFELSFVNMATDSTEFEKSIRIPFQKDGFDDVRAEYSQMLRQLIVDVLILDGAGVIVGLHPASAILKHSLHGDGLLGGPGHSRLCVLPALLRRLRLAVLIGLFPKRDHGSRLPS